jgi:PAS domain S-box-containing protein
MEAQRWVKSHIAEISSELQQVSSFTDLSKVFLARIAPLIKLGHGVFYIYEQDSQRLRLLGGYAYRERKNLDQYFSLGQGLVGQCALERAPIFITEPPEDYVRIGSSLGEGVPRTIAVLPVLRTERLLAVLELATFGTFGPNEQALLDGVMPILAMSLEILERNVKTKQLLEETQRQAENMEKQAARLEEQAVEMEAQQHEIKATEERSRLILGSVKDGIVGLDNNGVMTFANPAAYAMLGYAEEEFIGRPMHALVHHTYPDGREFPRHECRMYLTGNDGNPRTVDDEVLWCKDGTAIPVEYTTTPVFKEGQLVGTVITYRDIRARLAAQKAIAEQREAMQQILDHSPVGTAFTTHGKFRYLNPEFQEMFDLKVGDAAEKIYATPEDRTNLIADLQRDGIVRDREMRLVARNSELRDYLVTFMPFNSEGEQGVMGWLIDITERKGMEAEIKRTNFLTDIALELTNSGYWYVDYSRPDRYFQSERAARILGEHIKEDGLYDLDAEWFARLEEANPETAALTAERYQGAIDGKYDHYESIYAYKRPVDGNIVWVSAAGKLVRDEVTNKILFMYGAYQDITDIKLAEKELKHINMMTDSALDLTKAGYWLIDYSDPEYYTSSERAAAIFGEYPTEGWRYHLTEEWYNRIVDADPTVAEATSAHYAAAVAGSVPRYDCTYCYKRPIDGQVAWIRAIGNVTRDKNGKPLVMYGVSQDVTALRLSETKLAERMDELERFNHLTIDREHKMIELKNEINELLTQSGQESKYRIVS